MSRIAAIDYGLKRIGIAVSDPNRQIAFPLVTVEGGKKGIEQIRLAIKDKQVSQIIVGLPLLLNGKDGEMATAVRQFAKELETALAIPVILWDERLSSVQADRNLRELDLNRKQRTSKIDTAAAALLLQSYLDWTLYNNRPRT